jgi:hypothetical protein
MFSAHILYPQARPASSEALMTNRRTPPRDTALDLTTSDRLAKFIRLLGSGRDGEVVAAVNAMRRTLQGAGLDLHAIASRITDGDPDAKSDAYARGDCDGQRDAEVNAVTIYVAGGSREWREVAEFCAARAHRLSERERDFVTNMEKWTRRGLSLSPKQQEWLRSIRDRLRRVRP